MQEERRLELLSERKERLTVRWIIDVAFCAVVKSHKRSSNKIYKIELTKIR